METTIEKGTNDHRTTTRKTAVRVFADAAKSKEHSIARAPVQIIRDHYYDIYYNTFMALGAHKRSMPKDSGKKESWVIKPAYTEAEVVTAISALTHGQLKEVIHTLRYLAFSPYEEVKHAVQKKLEELV